VKILKKSVFNVKVFNSNNELTEERRGVAKPEKYEKQ